MSEQKPDADTAPTMEDLLKVIAGGVSIAAIHRAASRFSGRNPYEAVLRTPGVREKADDATRIYALWEETSRYWHALEQRLASERKCLDPDLDVCVAILRKQEALLPTLSIRAEDWIATHRDFIAAFCAEVDRLKNEQAARAEADSEGEEGA